jgi:hypothetical protein
MHTYRINGLLLRDIGTIVKMRMQTKPAYKRTSLMHTHITHKAIKNTNVAL